MRGKASIVAPSLLAADFLDLKKDIAKTEKAGADWHHVDVMDGHFVTNLSFGPPIVQAVKSCAKIPLDVHIMVSNPELVFQSYLDAGADYLTFHIEAVKDPLPLIKAIKGQGKGAGIAISPKTRVEDLEFALDLVDIVLVMSVEPGYGGQGFIPETLEKVALIAQRLAEKERADEVHLHVDGGVHDRNAKDILDKGATGLVAGSYIYKHPNRKVAIESLKEKI